MQQLDGYSSAAAELQQMTPGCTTLGLQCFGLHGCTAIGLGGAHTVEICQYTKKNQMDPVSCAPGWAKVAPPVLEPEVG